MNINCGETVDLSKHKACSDSLRGMGWLDSTNQMMFLGAPILKPLKTTVYKQEYVYGSGDNPCRKCITRLKVNVIPFPTITKTVYGCQGNGITIVAALFTQIGTIYDWTLPNGLIYPNAGPILTGVANNGDQYRVKVTYPSGCVQEIIITVSTLVPITHNKTINIICGDSIDLDALDECGNNGMPWYNSTSGGWHSSGKNGAFIQHYLFA